jgi:hypothetical protein
VPLTYERPSARTPDGRAAKAPAGAYTGDEVALRTGISPAALLDPELGLPAPGGGREQYAAIDVVRLAVVDRLVRSGVPVAHAAALLRAAESRVRIGIRADEAFPNSGTRVQTGSAMTVSH